MKKLMLLMIFLMMSLVSTSQNVIKDSTITLEKPIARLVIKDLITGDAAKAEVKLLSEKVNLLENKSILHDSLINNLITQNNNFQLVIETQSEQLNLSQQLSNKLQTDLKIQKSKTKIFGIGGGVALAAVLALLLTN